MNIFDIQRITEGLQKDHTCLITRLQSHNNKINGFIVKITYDCPQK